MNNSKRGTSEFEKISFNKEIADMVNGEQQIIVEDSQEIKSKKIVQKSLDL